jgi:hypothetical protein
MRDALKLQLEDYFLKSMSKNNHNMEICVILQKEFHIKNTVLHYQ